MLPSWAQLFCSMHIVFVWLFMVGKFVSVFILSINFCQSVRTLVWFDLIEISVNLIQFSEALDLMLLHSQFWTSGFNRYCSHSLIYFYLYNIEWFLVFFFHFGILCFPSDEPGLKPYIYWMCVNHMTDDDNDITNNVFFCWFRVCFTFFRRLP